MALRRAAAMAAAIGLALAMVPIAPVAASGGGGCGGPVTSSTGTDVQIKDYCFAPTVLFIEPGETVTWTNDDPMRHNVAGANIAWGSFEYLKPGRDVSYSFSQPGVYSYFCSLHVGMLGTVVVGDPVPGESIGSKAVRRIKQVSATQPAPVEPTSTSDATTLWFTALAALGLLVALLVGRRMRRRLRAS
jgi:plastocyanin